MNQGLISKRYAKALYRHAAELGEDALLYHRMQILEAVLKKMPTLRDSLKSPLISNNTKRGLLSTATGKNAEQSYLDFVEIVVNNGRTEALLLIAMSYQQLYRKKKNINVVHLTSAHQLSDKAIERMRLITEQKTHGKVEFSNSIDPTLDGGFIFQLNDLRIDASVRGQLEHIRRRLAMVNKAIV